MPFNPKYAEKLEKEVIAGLVAQTGCFNWQCRKPDPTKRCSNCGVAIYCSKECQIQDWTEKAGTPKGGGSGGNKKKKTMSKKNPNPHKLICKTYCANTNSEHWKGGIGQEFPPFIGLLSVGLVSESECFIQMKRRADALLRRGRGS